MFPREKVNEILKNKKVGAYNHLNTWVDLWTKYNVDLKSIPKCVFGQLSLKDMKT